MNAEAERIKLTAAFLNNAAVGIALAGFIKPLVDAADASLTRYAWLLAAATLNLLARWSLAALEDDPYE